MLQIFQDFSAYLKSSERSILTIKNYLADLRHFEKWFLETNDYSEFNPPDVTPTDLREFKQFLQVTKEMKPASINRRLASLRSFLKWTNEVGIAPIFQLSKIPKFEKTEKTGIRWLDRKEENALLRSVERSGVKRDIAIIKLLLHTGLRVAELCSLGKFPQMGGKSHRILSPQSFKPMGCGSCVANCMCDVSMPEVVLDQSGVTTLIS